MPEFSDYVEGLDPVVGALAGDELIPASKDGEAVSLTPSQIAALGGGGGTWGSITGTLSSQTDLQSALDAKAPLASPVLTGNPTAPTPTAGDNDTSIATTAFVQTALTTATVVSASTSTAGATITLDMDSKIQKIHVGSATFAAAKVVAMSNTTNSLSFQFIFEVTNVAAVLTVPADWLMSTPDFDGADWTPPATGKYVFGGSWNGTNWYVNAAGPYV